jgi:polyvinyl alcohol dehydrogenase (cytochrome)
MQGDDRPPSRRRVTAAAGLILIGAGLAGPGCGADGGSGSDDSGEGVYVGHCDWPTWGQSAERTFSYPDDCDTDLAPDTVDDLQEAWSFTTDDAVTATPAIAGGRVFVGDWSGRFYALDLESGELEWSYQAEVHPQVYAGQIVSSAAVADMGDRAVVYFGTGKTLHALDAEDGSEIWSRELGRSGADGDDDPTEIESSPVVVDGMVLFGTDVHNSPGGEEAGLVALDAGSGAHLWTAVTAPTIASDDGNSATGPGCGDVWGSPSVDLERRLAFVGTGNCLSDEDWGPNSEALLAFDLDTGRRVWGHQPHDQNLDDLDLAGAPNLFRLGDRDVVGLGGKDGVYSVVDREDGSPVWQRQVAEPGIPDPGANYSTGGFIGATAVVDDLVVGGTAVGGDPYLHALDAATGEIAWQQSEPGPTYAAAAEAGGVVFIGATDFTFRAVDLASGEVLWSQEMPGAVAGGAAVAGNDVVVVAGLREPGDSNPNRTAGVHRFTLDEVDDDAPDATDEDSDKTTTTTTTSAEQAEPLDSAALEQPCVVDACPLSFELTGDRVDGDTGSGTVHIEARPFRVTVDADGLGPPDRWLRPGSAAEDTGAQLYGVYLSEGTDDPVGGLVCVLDDDFDCTGTENPLPGASFDRLSILAVDEAGELPSITEGFDRMVATNSLAVPFAP